MANKSDKNDTGLLREIDEELRQEHYEVLWKRYGSYLIAAAVMLVVGVAGYKGWQNYDYNQRSEAGTQFYAATSLVKQGNMDQAFEAFNEISKDSPEGYQALASFRAAGVLSNQGDLSAAALAYNDIASKAANPKDLRDLATLLSVVNSLDSGSPESLSAKLAPLTVIDSAWRFSALELSAVLALRKGDEQGAIDTLTQLSADPSSPAGVRKRSDEILASLNAQQ